MHGRHRVPVSQNMRSACSVLSPRRCNVSGPRTGQHVVLGRLDVIKSARGLHLRIPPDLRKRVDAARKTTGRSLNGEILALIEAALDINEPSLMSTVQSLKESVDALNKRLDDK